MVNRLLACFDVASKWVRLILSALLITSGPLLAFDFEKLANENVEWSGPLSYLTNSLVFWTFIISAALNGIISIYNLIREKTHATILAEKDMEIDDIKSQMTQNFEELSEIGNTIAQLFDGMLYGLAKQLNAQQNDQIRITLYIHDSRSFSFIPCGRYSPNPIFSVPGRSYYPQDQGCIGKGWENGWHFDNEVPDVAHRRRAYHLKEYGIDHYVTDSLAMKSCLYAAKRLHDPSENPVAVIVVESMHNDRFNSDDLRAILDNIDRDYGRIICTLRSFIPTPFNAAASGL